MARTTRGVVLKGMLRMVEKKGGPQALKKVKELYGEDLHISSLQDYPVETTKKIDSAIATVLFGKDNDESQFQVGIMLVDMYLETVLGRTAFALLGPDLKTLAINVSKVFSTFVSGLSFEVTDMGEKAVKIVMKNDPFPPYYRKGMYTRAIEIYHCKPHVELKRKSDTECEYLVAWE